MPLYFNDGCNDISLISNLLNYVTLPNTKNYNKFGRDKTVPETGFISLFFYSLFILLLLDAHSITLK